MATQYSQDITTDLEELNYTTVQDLYMWITHCVEKCQLGSNVPNFDIHYKEGEFSCRQEDFDDFICDTYGKVIDVIEFSIHYNKIGVFFIVRRSIVTQNVNIILYSKDKRILSRIAPMLKETVANGKLEDDSTKQLTIKNEHSTQQQSENTFWKGVLQQITANGIWWLLGSLFVTFLTYLGIDKFCL
jgi:hypothetical protein